MKRVLRWLAWGLGGAVSIALITSVVFYLLGGRRLNRPYEVQPQALTIAMDSASIARGQHLVSAITVCSGCHGEDLGGHLMEEEAGIFTLAAPNLTAGEGGAAARFSDADFVRAIRHGVNPQGRGMLVMHTDVYNNLGGEDLAAIIAYVKSRPPVDRQLATAVHPIGRVMVGLGMVDNPSMPFIPAEVIDHSIGIPDRPEPDTTLVYGRYLLSITLCRMCHGDDLRGAPPIDPSFPPAPNLTYRAADNGWTRDQFITAIRTGTTPDGRTLNSEVMPWDIFGGMTDDELIALWMAITELAQSG